jgi:Pup amidohydrolase
LTFWAQVLDGLDKLKLSHDFDIEDDPGDLARKLDWVLKLWLFNRYKKSRDCSWDHPLLSVLDLQYHRVDNLEGLFYKLQADNMTTRLLDEKEIGYFVDHAPEDTRAYFRSRCIQKFAREVFLLNWEVVGFDHGDVHRMVPLLNPLKGTREQFETIFSEAKDSTELIRRLENASD